MIERYEPLVSIVIPAYNASNYLGEAIKSALSQTYKRIEIIVVNDGSRDNGATEKIALSFEGKIRYFYKTNGGSSSALNCGIKNMSGEWFSWLSHDDLYYPSKIQEEIDFINNLLNRGVCKEDLPMHLFFAAANLIDSNGKIIHRESNNSLKSTARKINCENGAINLIAVPTQDGFHGCSCLIHRQAFNDVGLFDEKLRLLNDCDLWFRFYSSGYIPHFIPKVLVCGRVHKQQVSRQVGFSYHNSEQDMFWSRNYNWLLTNRPYDFKYIMMFCKTAYKKTRYEEGKAALKYATKIKPWRKVDCYLRSRIWYFYSIVRQLMKKAYLGIFQKA